MKTRIVAVSKSRHGKLEAVPNRELLRLKMILKIASCEELISALESGIVTNQCGGQKIEIVRKRRPDF